jgi:hypothetical protein
VKRIADQADDRSIATFMFHNISQRRVSRFVENLSLAEGRCENMPNVSAAAFRHPDE